MISKSCLLYANDHDGDLPPNLQTLVAEGLIEAEQLVSPLAPEGEPAPHYELLLLGKLESHSAGDVLVQDRFTIGPDGRTKRPVAYVNGRMEVLRE